MVADLAGMCALCFRFLAATPSSMVSAIVCGTNKEKGFLCIRYYRGGKLPNGDVWQELITETEAGYARDGFAVEHGELPSLRSTDTTNAHTDAGLLMVHITTTVQPRC